MQYTIVVDEPRYFDAKVVMLCRNDRVIELYAVDDHGLEEYAGRLEHTVTADRDQHKLDQLQRLVANIKYRIKERPLSRESLAWLEGLAKCGMLARYEDLH